MQIAQRSATDLSALPPTPFRERVPVVSSVNDLMGRLQERLAREREFLLVAALVLKTPLAVLQLNAQSLQDAPSGQRRNESVQHLNEGVKRATHTVHQLLALARSGADQESTALRPHDLVTLVRDRIGLSSQLALSRSVEVELEAPEACELAMNRVSIGALADNLVDNAVKYSPEGSLGPVAITAGELGLDLSVSDQGPGIPLDMRRKDFERFFRLPEQRQPGRQRFGLGHRRAGGGAASGQGHLELEQRELRAAGCGLLVSVHFKG